MRDKDQQRAFDLRLQVQGILKGLEDKDVSTQAENSLQRLIQETGTQWEAEFVLKELLSQLPTCSTASRKPRYRLASKIVTCLAVIPGSTSGQSVIIRQIVEATKIETSDANLQELASLVEEVSALSITQSIHSETSSPEGQNLSCMGQTLVLSLLQFATRSPARKSASAAYIIARGGLKGFFESLHVPLVRSAVLGHLRQLLRNMISGQLCIQVPEMYFPVQTAIELLGCDLPLVTLKHIIQSCLQGLSLQGEWQVRKEAAETVAVLTASIQVHKPSDAGSWDLEVSPSIQAISEYKAALIAALTDAKYDKIIHVRQAAVKALHELEYIPGSATMNGFTCAFESPSVGRKTGNLVCPRTNLTELPKSREGKESPAVKSTPKASRVPLKDLQTTTADVVLQHPSLNQIMGQKSNGKANTRDRLKKAFDFGIQVFAPDPPPSPPITVLQSLGSTPAEDPCCSAISEPDMHQRQERETYGETDAETRKDEVPAWLESLKDCSVPLMEIALPARETGKEPLRYKFQDGEWHAMQSSRQSGGDQAAEVRAGPQPHDSTFGGPEQEQHCAQSGRSGPLQVHTNHPEAAIDAHAAMPLTDFSGHQGGQITTNAEQLMQLPALLASITLKGTSDTDIESLQMALIASARRQCALLALQQGAAPSQTGAAQADPADFDRSILRESAGLAHSSFLGLGQHAAFLDSLQPPGSTLCEDCSPSLSEVLKDYSAGVRYNWPRHDSKEIRTIVSKGRSDPSNSTDHNLGRLMHPDHAREFVQAMACKGAPQDSLHVPQFQSLHLTKEVMQILEFLQVLESRTQPSADHHNRIQSHPNAPGTAPLGFPEGGQQSLAAVSWGPINQHSQQVADSVVDVSHMAQGYESPSAGYPYNYIHSYPSITPSSPKLVPRPATPSSTHLSPAAKEDIEIHINPLFHAQATSARTDQDASHVEADQSAGKAPFLEARGNSSIALMSNGGRTTAPQRARTNATSSSPQPARGHAHSTLSNDLLSGAYHMSPHRHGNAADDGTAKPSNQSLLDPVRDATDPMAGSPTGHPLITSGTAGLRYERSATPPSRAIPNMDSAQLRPQHIPPAVPVQTADLPWTNDESLGTDIARIVQAARDMSQVNDSQKHLQRNMELLKQMLAVEHQLLQKITGGLGHGEDLPKLYAQLKDLSVAKQLLSENFR